MPGVHFKYPESAKHALGDTFDYFSKKSVRDFSTVRHWLPTRLNSILDIGAGLGAINVMIWRIKRASLTNINIIDGDGSNENSVSYQEVTVPWFDRKIGKEFINANVSVKCNVQDYPPDTSMTIESDLIISLKSWGHHYPVSIYIDMVTRSLKPGGRVILDMRKHQKRLDISGLRLMEESGFHHLAKIDETPKCERMVFCRIGDE